MRDPLETLGDYSPPWQLDGDEILGEPTIPRRRKPKHDGNQKTAYGFVAVVLAAFCVSAGVMIYLISRVFVFIFWVFALAG